MASLHTITITKKEAAAASSDANRHYVFTCSTRVTSLEVASLNVETPVPEQEIKAPIAVSVWVVADFQSQR